MKWQKENLKMSDSSSVDTFSSDTDDDGIIIDLTGEEDVVV